MRQRMSSRFKWSAIVMALALLGAACGDDDNGVIDSGETSTTSTSPPPTVTPTTAVPIDYSKVAPPETIGTGIVVGTSRDGSAVYVEEEDPTFPEPGCEGQPAPVLFRLPVAGGKRELLATKAQPVRGLLERAAGGRVVLIDGCEGFLSALYVGNDTPDGRLGQLTKSPLPEGGRPAPNSLTWSTEGDQLVGADNLSGQNSEGPGGTPIVRIEPTSGKVTELFRVAGIETGVAQVEQLADATYAVAGGGRVQIFSASGELKSKADGNGFALSPDRRTLAVFGPVGSGLSRLQVGGEGPQPLTPGKAGRQIISAEFSPDGRAVAYVSSGDAGDDNRVELVVVDGAQVVPVVGPGPFGRVYFTGDGKALVMNRFQATPSNTFPVTVVTLGS